ncbi:MAG: hypothetical protein QT11_C0001G0802 [archaeon GW2011_AR20]|nr:MAG: hypothetical protein QT11_C0001G0802 [archaeon GW2011_AR20]MBS3160786.1 gamma-glutamylcyclotransferase [Candidatus Woesearchaeota archaeon]
MPNKNLAVAGLVLFVKREELKLIDKYEGKSYKREKVDLASKNRAWTYVFNCD